MPRVVADTNVYVSALDFGGAPGQVLELAQLGSIELFVSREILDELGRVLVRKFGWQPPQARSAIANILEYAYLVEPRAPVEVITADPADNRILECAVEANADVVVSGDRHLLAVGLFEGIQIVTPRKFLSAFGFDSSAT